MAVPAASPANARRGQLFSAEPSGSNQSRPGTVGNLAFDFYLSHDLPQKYPPYETVAESFRWGGNITALMANRPPRDDLLPLFFPILGDACLGRGTHITETSAFLIMLPFYGPVFSRSRIPLSADARAGISAPMPPHRRRVGAPAALFPRVEQRR